MGIGRRSFLKTMSAALAGMVVNPLDAVVVKDNIYLNRAMGILFKIPYDWGFISVVDFGSLKDKQILGNGIDDLNEEIDLDDPLCIATKYYQETPENKGVFSPTITLHVTPVKELEEDGINDFESARKLSLIGTQLILQDFEVVKEYEAQTLSGNTFYEYDAEYMFNHVDLEEPLKTELKVLKTVHNDCYYDFNLHQCSAQNQTAHIEFEEFIKSIKLI